MSGTILYIEDNQESIRLVRKILENVGYQMLAEKNAMLGMLIARSHKPDLILMDINLPWIDGVQALDRLRAEKVLQDIPVIAVTAHSDYGDRERFLKAGFDDYIPKPISGRDLVAAIKAIIDAKADKS